MRHVQAKRRVGGSFAWPQLLRTSGVPGAGSADRASPDYSSSAWFSFLAVGRKPAGVSLHIPGETGRLAPFRYGLLPGLEPCLIIDSEFLTTFTRERACGYRAQNTARISRNA
jgi:hypothetical protein